MKKIYFLAAIIAFGVFSCSEDEQISEPCTDQDDQVILSKSEIRSMIEQSLKETGDFSWNDVDPYVLWSAAMHGDSLLTVGYSQVPYSEELRKSEHPDRRNILEILQSIESESLQKASLDTRELLIYEPQKLNFMDVRITSLESVEALRTMEGVRYIEPNAFRYLAHDIMQKSSSGCDKTTVPVNSNDYTVVSPGCQVSWTYDQHNIRQAWNVSTGEGVGVGLIDTGVSDEQSLLGDDFNQGYSANRYVYKYGVYVDSWWPWSNDTDGHHDKCGHGTLMGATISGPRNSRNMPVGVAYNCNLVAYRATSNVVVDGYHEKRGVARALIELADRNDVKIISMSIGHIFSIGSISDAVRYAYSKDKLIVAAGRTSTTFTNWAGVIFPASMSETVAVTGVTDASTYEECDVCHKGDKIDFTIVMQHNYDSDRRSVSLGYYDNSRTYVGGSSVATATTAGIAALVWSNHPNWSRSQVLQRLKESSDLYPNRDDDFGWGTIDAYAAVQ